MGAALAPPRTLHGNSVAVPVGETTANRLISALEPKIS